MNATGIHDHPTKKTGKRAPKMHAALDFADLITAIPTHPLTDALPAVTWLMNENDAWGDCVVANTDNGLQAMYTVYGVARVNWTRAQILANYQTQNPSFDPSSKTDGPESNADGGMDIQTFLEYLQKQGEILAFARVDHTNVELMKAAVYLGGAVITGQVLQKAQQSQSTEWTYVAGSPEWGGHCTADVAYPDGEEVTETWTEVVKINPSFASHCRDEAWFVLVQPQVDHPEARKYLDLDAWAAAFTALTGRSFPVTPSPSPAPAPTPPAPAGADADLAAAAHAWVKTHHTGINATMQRAVQAWLAAKGL